MTPFPLVYDIASYLLRKRRKSCFHSLSLLNPVIGLPMRREVVSNGRRNKMFDHGLLSLL